MDTPDEIARDEWMTDLVDKISKEAIAQFTLERLRSYYLGNQDVAVQAIAIFREAEKIQEQSPTAALVLFTTAIELGLKVAMLKPVIYGLVHNESVADLVSDLAVKHNGFDRFKRLLGSVLAEYGEIDLDTFAIEGHRKTIWEEIAVLQYARNAVVHRGDFATPEDALLAKHVATMIFGTFLVAMLTGLGLRYSKGGHIAAT